MSKSSVLAKTDVHLAKGKRAQREFENSFRKAGDFQTVYDVIGQFGKAIARTVARNSRLEYARRVKKMKRRSATIDMFEN